nr:PAN domain-containing protein [Novosphingobium sp. B 225]
MNRRKRALTALALAVLPTAVLADFVTGGFLGPDLWTDPAPGGYSFKLAGTNLCAQREAGATRAIQPHLVLRTCNAALFDQDIELVPNGTTRNPLTLASPVTWRIQTRQKCMTVARFVVFGPPAVDELDCGTRAEAADNPARIGADDQTWRLRQRGGTDQFEIRAQDNRCWTAQGSQPRDGVQLVMEPCNDSLVQRFELARPRSGVITPVNRRAAEDFGWFSLDRQFSPFLFRSLPRLNIESNDLPGGAGPTANDSGLACARACAQNFQCRAYTWVDPRARGGTPMCYQKSGINALPVADNFTMSGIVVPH